MADLTPNNREEYWLKGMVDGQTTLEPNKRREFWYKEIVDAIGSGGGGGTGGGVLKINVNKQGQMDKTYAEIKAAFLEGIVFSIQSISEGDCLCIVTNCNDNEGDGCNVTLQRLYGGGFEMSFECQTVNDYPAISH